MQDDVILHAMTPGDEFYSELCLTLMNFIMKVYERTAQLRCTLS